VGQEHERARYPVAIVIERAVGRAEVMDRNAYRGHFEPSVSTGDIRIAAQDNVSALTANQIGPIIKLDLIDAPVDSNDSQRLCSQS
jgi:hypothetical protein